MPWQQEHREQAIDIRRLGSISQYLDNFWSDEFLKVRRGFGIPGCPGN